MKKTLLLNAVLGVASVLLLTGCGVATSTYTYTSRSGKVALRDLPAHTQHAKLNVDYSQRVTAVSDPQTTQRAAIEDAQYKCIERYGIDVVVDPIYKTEYKGGNQPFTVTVLGFAGRYVSDDSDLDSFKEKGYTMEDVEKYKMLTDPDFMKYYYQKDQVPGDVVNYYINKGAPAAEAAPDPAPALQPALGAVALENLVPAADKKKAKQEQPVPATKSGILPFGRKPSDKFTCGLEFAYISKNTSYNGTNYSLMGRKDPAYTPGFRFGLLINPTFKYGLGFKTGIYMDFVHEYDSKSGSSNDRLNDIAFNVPLQVSFRYEMARKFSLLLYTGPHLDFELWNQRGESDRIYEAEDCFDLQWGIGGGFQYSHMRLTVGGEFGMINQTPNGGTPKTLRNKPVVLSLSIMF